MKRRTPAKRKNPPRSGSTKRRARAASITPAQPPTVAQEFIEVLARMLADAVVRDLRESDPRPTPQGRVIIYAANQAQPQQPRIKKPLSRKTP